MAHRTDELSLNGSIYSTYREFGGFLTGLYYWTNSKWLLAVRTIWTGGLLEWIKILTKSEFFQGFHKAYY